MHRLNHQWLAPLEPGKCFFGRFLLRLNRIKRSQVISMGKFGLTAPYLGFDFFLLITFLGHPVGAPIVASILNRKLFFQLILTTQCVSVLMRRANLDVTPRVGQSNEDGYGHRCQSVAVSLTRFVRVPLC